MGLKCSYGWEPDSLGHIAQWLADGERRTNHGLGSTHSRCGFFKFFKEIYYTQCVKKVNQSHYRPKVPKGFQEVKVPRLHDNGPIYSVYEDKLQNCSCNQFE